MGSPVRLHGVKKIIFKFRIVGGEETEINEYPMMSALIDLDLKFLLCGATIISERQLITAAHCICHRPIDEIGVRVGVHNLSEGIELSIFLKVHY